MYCYIVRLACVKPAASVRSEPESNSQVWILANRSYEFMNACAICLYFYRTLIFGNTHNIILIECALDLYRLVIVHNFHMRRKWHCAVNFNYAGSSEKVHCSDTTPPALKCSSHYQITDRGFLEPSIKQPPNRSRSRKDGLYDESLRHSQAWKTLFLRFFYIIRFL